MQRYILIGKLFLSLIIASGLYLLVAASRHGGAVAATMRIADIPLGRVIEINGQKFVKVRIEIGKGSQFVAMQKSCVGLNPQTTMQGWTGCSALATPAPASFTQGPILTDTRDCKTYEIRKFADGKCWMADNLMYGGTTDNCAGVGATGYTGAYGGASGSAGYSNRFGANTFGNCRDPRVEADAFSPCYNSTDCGYHYNWQAAMQLSSAYYNRSVSYPNGAPSTTNFHQGICPAGWHLPSGNTGGEFAQLDIANGGTGVYSLTVNAVSNFWRPGFAYKGVSSGNVDYIGGSLFSDGSSYSQGASYQWSSSEYSAMSAWSLYVTSDGAFPDSYGNKRSGFTVRCVKN